ncbi:MAG: ImmA/IrrE family metallo-endopeptidase [Planctomycetota bacterium]
MKKKSENTNHGQVPRVQFRTQREIESLARKEVEAIEGYKPGSPVPVQDYIEYGILKKRHNVTYAVSNLPSVYVGKFEIDKTSRNKIITIDQSQWIKGLAGNGEEKIKARFTMAHEIGHAILNGEEMIEMAECQDQRVLYKKGCIEPPNECPEWQADRFAEAMLMPAVSVRRLLDEYKSNQSGGFGNMVIDRMSVPRQLVVPRVRTLVRLKLVDNVFTNYRNRSWFWWGK